MNQVWYWIRGHLDKHALFKAFTIQGRVKSSIDNYEAAMSARWSLKEGTEKKVILFFVGVAWEGLLEEVTLPMSLEVGIRIIKGTMRSRGRDVSCRRTELC